MDNSNTNEVKNFLLKHKKDFQEYLNNNLNGIACFRCLIHKAESELHYKNSCIGIYRYIATSLNKIPKSKNELLTCEDLYREMVRLASSSTIIKNE
jgi:hypothetical protein